MGTGQIRPLPVCLRLVFLSFRDGPKNRDGLPAAFAFEEEPFSPATGDPVQASLGAVLVLLEVSPLQ